eukprot:TRINITY_DN18018_c0_g1_i1.p1 TRINITY_DN18018_c0_g1~~TRINITY_DN18018_c0_g1_i1.p1  ORF type:complete len:461 (-),score=76.10 TRINITY_DN18018_c0_g1_i1:121-1503(-)
MHIFGKLTSAAEKVHPGSDGYAGEEVVVPPCTGSGLGSAVASGAKDVAAKGFDVASKLKEAGGEKMGMGQASVKELVAQLEASVEMLIKRKIHVWTEEKLVNRLPPLAKDMLEDSEAPKFVNMGKDKAIDAVWPEIKEEIMWEVALLLHGKALEDEDQLSEPGSCCCLAWLRYHLYPYDRGFWAQRRDPFFVFVKLLSLIPFWGVLPALYLFNFLIIDRGDTNQLVQFILNFKGTQFVTLGVIRCMVGYISFFLCVTARGKKDNHSCEEKGPGSSGEFLATSVGFLFQMVLTWVAFCLLRCSKDKTRRRLTEPIGEQEMNLLNRRGGALIWFLLYDIMIFFLCLGALAYAFTTVDDRGGWIIQHTVFGLQIVYGLASLPFFIFTLPGIQLILTHSVASAYDRVGRVRRPCKAPARQDAKKLARKDPSMQANLLTDRDMSEVMGTIRKDSLVVFAVSLSCN